MLEKDYIYVLIISRMGWWFTEGIPGRYESNLMDMYKELSFLYSWERREGGFGIFIFYFRR